MEGVRLRVKNEGKCVSSYCLFDIEGGGSHFISLVILNCLPFILKIRLSSLFEKIVVVVNICIKGLVLSAPFGVDRA